MTRYLLVFLVFFAAIRPAHSADNACIDWARLMTSHNISGMVAGRPTVLIESFDDYTKRSGDDWLSFGIPRLLSDYLSVGENINAIFGAAGNYLPQTIKPTYTVTGMYQHVQGRLRVFIKLLERDELLKQFQVDIQYPQNKQFFDTMGDTALSILEIVSPPYNKDELERIKAATSTVPAYENYIRAMTAYETFDVTKMEVAKMWLEESKKADINFSGAYQGLAEVYIFLAMYNKQNRLPFSGYFELADREFRDEERFSKRPEPSGRPKKIMIKMKKRPREVKNRFLLSDASFIAGLHAADSGQWGEAARLFEEALALVPEDAITWNHLAKVRDKLGAKGSASAARAKALAINKCLQ